MGFPWAIRNSEAVIYIFQAVPLPYSGSESSSADDKRRCFDHADNSLVKINTDEDNSVVLREGSCPMGTEQGHVGDEDDRVV
jgi:hypothetical protein